MTYGLAMEGAGVGVPDLPVGDGEMRGVGLGVPEAVREGRAREEGVAEVVAMSEGEGETWAARF